MKTYKVYVTAEKGNIVRQRVLTGITPSMKTNAVRKALYKGYQIKSEGLYFIVLEKNDKGVIKTAGIFIE